METTGPEWETARDKVVLEIIQEVSDKEHLMEVSEINLVQEILIKQDRTIRQDQITINNSLNLDIEMIVALDQATTAASDPEVLTLEAAVAVDLDPVVLLEAVEWDPAAEAAVSDPAVDNILKLNNY